MDLPVFEMVINPEESSEIEVSFVALVDRPAIERNFLAFKSNTLHFAINDEQRIISGPAMVADSLIYRKDDNGEYNVFFSKETIKDISVKFFKKGYEKNVNLFHDPNLKTEGVTIFESFISDKERGIQPMKGFEDLPDGSWFISAKIENDQVWNGIKSGELKGFSVEGIFSYVKRKDLSATQKNNSHLEEIDFMSEIKDLWSAFKEKFLGEPTPPPPAQSMGQEYALKDGTKVMIDRLEPGGVVMVGEAPAPAGEHELADGTKIMVAEGGVIQQVMPMQSQNPNDYSEQFKTYDEKFTSYEQKFADYEQKFTAFNETVNALTASFNSNNEKLTQLIGLVQKIVETPTAEPTDTQKNFSTQKQNSKEEKRKELASLFAKIKK